MNARLFSIVACVSSLAAGAIAHAEGNPPRVDQRPHRVEYDPASLAGGVLKQPLVLSKLEPKRPHTLYFRSPLKPERMYARDPKTGKTIAEATAYHQFKDAKGNPIYVSKLLLKEFSPDVELILQSNAKARWAHLLFCDEVVVNGNDSGVGSLRGGIANVRNGGSVCFDPAVFDQPTAPTVLLGGEILVGKNVDVHGTTLKAQVNAGGRDRALQFGIATDSTMDDVTLFNGSAARGGLIWNRGTLALDGVSLWDGHADDGGAILNSEHLTLRDSGLSGNEAIRGGGLFNDDGTVLMFASAINNNVADQGGGVFGLNGGFIMHDGSRISSNEATDGGGAYFQDASFHGNNYLYGGTVGANVAQRGGGIFLDGGGLIVEFVGGRSEITGQAVDGNTAWVDGGGIYVTQYGVLDIRTGNHVVRNATVGRGGGIFNLGYVYVKEASVIDDNFADDGGGVYNDNVLELFDAARIADNIANYSGGGVYNTTNAELHAWSRDGRITGNRARFAGTSGAGGGVANFGSGFVDVLSSVIVGNTPTNLVNLP